MISENSLYGDELLVAALGQLPPHSRFRISDEADVVDALYQIRQNPEFSVLFENYPFDEDGMRPRSSAISEGLHSLQQSRLLGRMNPDLIDYSIDPALKIRYEMTVKPKLRNCDVAGRFAAEVKRALKVKPPAVEHAA